MGATGGWHRAAESGKRAAGVGGDGPGPDQNIGRRSAGRGAGGSAWARAHSECGPGQRATDLENSGVNEAGCSGRPSFKLDAARILVASQLELAETGSRSRADGSGPWTVRRVGLAAATITPGKRPRHPAAIMARARGPAGLGGQGSVGQPPSLPGLGTGAQRVRAGAASNRPGEQQSHGAGCSGRASFKLDAAKTLAASRLGLAGLGSRSRADGSGPDGPACRAGRGNDHPGFNGHGVRRLQLRGLVGRPALEDKSQWVSLQVSRGSESAEARSVAYRRDKKIGQRQAPWSAAGGCRAGRSRTPRPDTSGKVLFCFASLHEFLDFTVHRCCSVQSFSRCFPVHLSP